MLRSLVTKAPEKDKTKEERKVAKNFFQALDARMEANQPEKKGIRPAEVPDKPKIVTQTSNPQAILAKEDGYCPTRTNQAVHMSADELLAERKRAMAEFEREREKKRLENLERMRLEKEKKGGQNSNKERSNPQRDAGDAMLGKRKDNLQSKPIHGTIGYNPLAPNGDMSQKLKPSQPAQQKNDPSFDPRFQFSLKVAESRPSQPPIVAKPPAYNPLQPAKAVESASDKERRPLQKPVERVERVAYEVTPQRAEMLRQNREAHYEVEPKRPPPQVRPPPRQSLPPPPAPPQARPPVERKYHPEPPRPKPVEYNPLAPHRESQRQLIAPPSYNPLQSARNIHHERPVDPELKLIMDLKKFRKTVPTSEPEPKSSTFQPRAPPGTDRVPPQPKAKKINPKNDPNCLFCFRCQEWHHKDLHMQSIPQFTASRAPVARTVPAQRSQPNQHELRAQQTAISRAIQREPVHIPRKLLRQVDSEDEDDFDYDDGFIVDDMDEPQDWNSELRKVTKYYPEQYDDEDFDDRDMEVRDFAELEREDLRSRYYGSLHVKRPSR